MAEPDSNKVIVGDDDDSEVVQAMPDSSVTRTRSLRERKTIPDASIPDVLDEVDLDMLEEKEGLGSPPKKITPSDNISCTPVTSKIADPQRERKRIITKLCSPPRVKKRRTESSPQSRSKPDSPEPENPTSPPKPSPQSRSKPDSPEPENPTSPPKPSPQSRSKPDSPEPENQTSPPKPSPQSRSKPASPQPASQTTPDTSPMRPLNVTPPPSPSPTSTTATPKAAAGDTPSSAQSSPAGEKPKGRGGRTSTTATPKAAAKPKAAATPTTPAGDTPSSAQSSPAGEKPKGRGGRQKGSKNKPKMNSDSTERMFIRDCVGTVQGDTHSLYDRLDGKRITYSNGDKVYVYLVKVLEDHAYMIPNYPGKGQNKTPWGRGCKYCNFHTWDGTYHVKECPTDPDGRKDFINHETNLLRRFRHHWINDHRDVYREYRKGVNLASFQRKFQQAQADAEVIHEVKIYVTALEALRHITGKLVNNESFLRFKDMDANAFDHIVAKQVGLLEKGKKQDAPTSKQLHNWLQGQHKYYMESFKKILENKGVHLSFDFGNVHHTDFIAVTANYTDADGPKELLLACEQMPKPDASGRSIYEYFEELLKRFGLEHYQLLSSTSDSAANCVKSVKILNEEHGKTPTEYTSFMNHEGVSDDDSDKEDTPEADSEDEIPLDLFIEELDEVEDGVVEAEGEGQDGDEETLAGTRQGDGGDGGISSAIFYRSIAIKDPQQREAITNFGKLIEENIQRTMKCDEQKCGLIVGGVCLNHQVELALKQAAKVKGKGYNRTIINLAKLVSKIMNNKKLRRILVESGQRMLTRYVETRWSSRMNMIKRFLELFDNKPLLQKVKKSVQDQKVNKKFDNLWPTPDQVLALREVLEVLECVDTMLTIPAQAHEATIVQMFTMLDTVFFTLRTSMPGNLFARRVFKFLHLRVNKIVRTNAGWQVCLYLHPLSRSHLEMIASGTQSYTVTQDEAKTILQQAPKNCRLLGERLHRISLRANLSPEEKADEEADLRRANADADNEDSEGDEYESPETAPPTGMMTPIQKMFWNKQQEFKEIQAQAAAKKKKKEQRDKQKDPLDVMKKHLKAGLKDWSNIEESKLHALTYGYQREVAKIKEEIAKVKKSKSKDFDVEERQKLYKQGAMTATHRMLTARYEHVAEKICYPPGLVSLMTNFNNLPVSNARCERIFSHLKLVYSSRRYNLEKETIHAIMFLKMNKLVPKKSQAFWDRQVKVTKKTATKELEK